MLQHLLDRHGPGRIVGAAAVLVVVVVGLGLWALTGGNGDDGSAAQPSGPSISSGPVATAPVVPGATTELDQIAVADTPAVPAGAIVNAKGTYFSTLGAPAAAMAWMQSDKLLFNQPLPDDTPAVPDSAAIAGRIDEIVRGKRLFNYQSGIEHETNSPVILLVDSNREDFVDVHFRPQACGDDRWWNWTAADFEPYINDAYAAIGRSGIPVPANFNMSPDDSDSHLMVYDWRRDNLIELWHTKTTNLTGQPGIQACWGGIIKHFAQNGSGIYPFPMGVFAAGITAPGLTITLADLQQGEIRHAIAVSSPIGINNANPQSMSYPAVRNDGRCSDSRSATDDSVRQVTQGMGGERYCLYEGQQLRLPPDYNVDAITNPYARMVARAVRDYGMVLVDDAGCFCLQGESGLTSSINGLGGDKPWEKLLVGTTDADVMQQIDWTKLRVLPRDWGRPDGYKIACSGPLVGAPAAANPMAGDPRCQNPVAPYTSG